MMRHVVSVCARSMCGVRAASSFAEARWTFVIGVRPDEYSGSAGFVADCYRSWPNSVAGRRAPASRYNETAAEPLVSTRLHKLSDIAREQLAR